jgi:hypothetical protein
VTELRSVPTEGRIVVTELRSGPTEGWIVANQRDLRALDAELAYMVAEIETNKADFGSRGGELRVRLGVSH